MNCLHLYRILLAYDISVMACVGMYGCQRVIARHNLTLSVYGRVFCRLFLMELLCRLFGGESSDMEGSLRVRRKELTAHLMGNDAHVEAEIDFDARMYSKLRINNCVVELRLRSLKEFKQA